MFPSLTLPLPLLRSRFCTHDSPFSFVPSSFVFHFLCFTFVSFSPFIVSSQRPKRSKSVRFKGAKDFDGSGDEHDGSSDGGQEWFDDGVGAAGGASLQAEATYEVAEVVGTMRSSALIYDLAPDEGAGNMDGTGIGSGAIHAPFPFAFPGSQGEVAGAGSDTSAAARDGAAGGGFGAAGSVGTVANVAEVFRGDGAAAASVVKRSTSAATPSSATPTAAAQPSDVSAASRNVNPIPEPESTYAAGFAVSSHPSPPSPSLSAKEQRERRRRSQSIPCHGKSAAAAATAADGSPNVGSDDEGGGSGSRSGVVEEEGFIQFDLTLTRESQAERWGKRQLSYFTMFCGTRGLR